MFGSKLIFRFDPYLWSNYTYEQSHFPKIAKIVRSGQYSRKVSHSAATAVGRGREGEAPDRLNEGEQGENRGIGSAYSVLDHLFYYMVYITMDQARCQEVLEQKFLSLLPG